MTAIIGPSGSGKTTFARCLLGIWPHTTGDLLLDDTSIATWPRETFARKLIHEEAHDCAAAVLNRTRRDGVRRHVHRSRQLS